MQHQQPKSKKTAIVSAIDMLAIRSYGTAELERKLKHKGYEETAIDEAVQKLTERGYLDDTTLCVSLFEQYCYMKKYSLQHIRQKLMQRGFSRNLIEKCMKNVDDEVELAAASKLLTQKYRSPEIKEELLMKKFLYGRGFSLPVIEKAIAQLG